MRQPLLFFRERLVDHQFLCNVFAFGYNINVVHTRRDAANVYSYIIYTGVEIILLVRYHAAGLIDHADGRFLAAIGIVDDLESTVGWVWHNHELLLLLFHLTYAGCCAGHGGIFNPSHVAEVDVARVVHVVDEWITVTLQRINIVVARYFEIVYRILVVPHFQYVLILSIVERIADG